MNLGHGQWTTCGTGPSWTEARAMVGSSPELLLPADSVHGSQPQGGENDKGVSGIRFCSLPKTERRCGGGVVRGWTAAT
jgi:hypothetical protein